MLEIKDLKAQFEDTAILKGVNLKINKGEVHVILGPNGSGKSTLGRVLLGDKKYKKTAGKILFTQKLAETPEILDFDNLSVSERAKAGFFLSFQSPPEIDGVSVKNFLFAAKKAQDPKFSSSFRFKKELKKHLTDLRLAEEFIEREINKGFSGGERKKIEMASLLVLKPQLAFLDEIDSGVDIDTVRKIGTKIREFLAEDESRSVILVSHSEKLLHEIKPTHVHIFCQGKITHSGGAEIIEKVNNHGFDHFLDKPKLEKIGFKVV
jgi:Fe-S cluster assembly ATP-binding protein